MHVVILQHSENVLQTPWYEAKNDLLYVCKMTGSNSQQRVRWLYFQVFPMC